MIFFKWYFFNYYNYYPEKLTWRNNGECIQQAWWSTWGNITINMTKFTKIILSLQYCISFNYYITLLLIPNSIIVTSIIHFWHYIIYYSVSLKCIHLSLCNQRETWGREKSERDHGSLFRVSASESHRTLAAPTSIL